VTVFLTDRDVGVAELARAVEERGFASLFLPEHTHIPVRRATPAPTGEHPLPGAYARTLDPWVALSAAGAVTTRLRLGTGVSLPAQHDPIALAKQIATLDHLSGGRVTLGVGYGWNFEEIADHGIDPQRRRAVVREHILAMQALWRDDVASFDGEHVAFEPSWAWPKPVQRPRVRTLVGGAAGPTLVAHLAEWADGWLPVGGAGIAEALPRLRAALAEAGRDPATLQVVPLGTEPSAGKLEHFRELGVTEVALRVAAGGRDVVLPALDALTAYL